MTLILGLTGAAGSGKSTVAQHLHDRYGAIRFSFADPLKAMVALAFDLTRDQVYGTQAQKEAVDPRYNVSPRWLLQRIGTEGCRAVFGKDFWTEMTLRQIGRVPGLPLAVIEDVRFENEAAAIVRTGGLVWRLECPDRISSDDGTHASEREWMRIPCQATISARLSPGSRNLLDAVDRTVAASPSIRNAFRLGA